MYEYKENVKEIKLRFRKIGEQKIFPGIFF